MYPSKEELLRKLGNFEDNFVERKPVNAGEKDFRETLVAFANSVPDQRTAVLYIGVDNSGNSIGLRDKSADSLQETLRRIAEEKCFPPISFKAECLEAQGKNILAIVVPPSLTKPHFSGPAYVRVGSSNKIASEELYRELITSHHSKARAIQQMKGKRVIFCHPQFQQGTPNGRLVGKAFGEIVECTAHTVKAQFEQSKKLRTFSIENVQISYDDSMGVDMLIVGKYP